MNSRKYGRQLTQAEIDANVHRVFVGGMWDEIGILQIDFLKKQGMKPCHYFLDVGCGALRGGVHFTRYLDKGHYYGMDINASLIEAGKKELQEAGLMDKHPHLLVNGKFEVSQFGVNFDYAIAQSVFTHLPMNDIIRCLVEVRKVMKADAIFFATFFEAPATACLSQITHTPGGVVTNYDINPFHYSFEEFKWMARVSGMNARLIGEWKHPRDQRMLSFSVTGY
jgi:ubiquinone/menaquinone biosynthesis C-methylase UbiE